MPKLLVSVRSLEEALVAGEFEIDILDVKEPRNGALGLADLETLKQIGKQSFSRPMRRSIAAGELNQWLQRFHDSSASRFGDLMPLELGSVLGGYDFVKVGLAGMADSNDWGDHWLSLMADVPAKVSPVAVAYADYFGCHSPKPTEIIRGCSREPRCQTLLIDTYDKSKQLFDYLDLGEISLLVAEAKALGWQTVIAGSVRVNDFEKVANCGAELVGVRGAITEGDRSSRLCASKLGRLLACLKRHS